jgi:hypothetical protein
MWFINRRKRARVDGRPRHVRPTLESLESRLVPSSAGNVIQVYPVQDLVVPLAQVGQPALNQMDSQFMMLYGMNALPGLSGWNNWSSMAPLLMATDLAGGPAALASNVSNAFQQFGMSDFTGNGHGFSVLRWLSDLELLGFIDAWVNTGNQYIGVPHFGGFFPGNSGAAYGLGGLGVGALTTGGGPTSLGY